MTADVRTAAQREAERRWPLKYPDEINLEQRRLNMPTLLARGDFVDGYLAGAARITPTREQIQERMQEHHFDECVYDGGVRTNWWFAKCSCGWEGPESAYPQDAHDAYYVHASEQVAALLGGLAEGESSAGHNGT